MLLDSLMCWGLRVQVMWSPGRGWDAMLMSTVAGVQWLCRSGASSRTKNDSQHEKHPDLPDVRNVRILVSLLGEISRKINLMTFPQGGEGGVRKETVPPKSMCII